MRRSGRSSSSLAQGIAHHEPAARYQQHGIRNTLRNGLRHGQGCQTLMKPVNKAVLAASASPMIVSVSILSLPVFVDT